MYVLDVPDGRCEEGDGRAGLIWKVKVRQGARLFSFFVSLGTLILWVKKVIKMPAKMKYEPDRQGRLGSAAV